MDEHVRFAHNGDVQLAYEAFGDLDRGEPLLLVMGLDFQMVWWPDELVKQFVDAGFAVVRFDNRDTGLSTHFAPIEKPDPWKALMGGVAPAYTQDDMHKDVLAVMDAVGWESAHVMGGSLGAGIAQGLAMEFPDRVRSLISCMGLPIDSGVLGTLRYVRPGVLFKLAKLGLGDSDDEQVEVLVEIFRAISSPGYPFPEAWAREAACTSHRRSPRDPSTTQRQIAAGRAHKYPRLSTVSVPTLVISGKDDPLVRWTGGRDTAARIPGAKFVLYPGMGHSIPAELVPDIVSEVSRLVGLSAGSLGDLSEVAASGR